MVRAWRWSGVAGRTGPGGQRAGRAARGPLGVASGHGLGEHRLWRELAGLGYASEKPGFKAGNWRAVGKPPGVSKPQDRVTSRHGPGVDRVRVAGVHVVREAGSLSLGAGLHQPAARVPHHALCSRGMIPHPSTAGAEQSPEGPPAGWFSGVCRRLL